MNRLTRDLLELGSELGKTCDRLHFGAPVWAAYNTLKYAWAGYATYLEAFATGHKPVVFLGMNPGPWGMAQTGVPFGEIKAVRDWMGIEVKIGKPAREHPKRPVDGFACTRSEVSGRRLWGLFAEVYGPAEAFFSHALVLNYCPLSFLRESGANLTPDRLPAADRAPLEAACDAHLQRVLELLEPRVAVGVGGFATKCLRRVDFPEQRIRTLLHPSPASPVANREWPERPRRQLREMGLIG